MDDLGAMRVRVNNIEAGREVHVVLDPLGSGPEEVVLTAHWEASGALWVNLSVLDQEHALELLTDQVRFGADGPEVT